MARFSAEPKFNPPAGLLGEWSGTVRTYDGKTTPIKLTVKPDDVHVMVASGLVPLWTVLNGASFEKGMLAGNLLVDVPTEDARRHPHFGMLSLWLGDGKLRGSLGAVWLTQPPGGVMSSYVELTPVK